MNILHENKGCYVIKTKVAYEVYIPDGTASKRQATFGLTLPTALQEAIKRCDSLATNEHLSFHKSKKSKR